MNGCVKQDGEPCWAPYCSCTTADVPDAAGLRHAMTQFSEPATADRGSRLVELREALLDSETLEYLPAPRPLIDGILYADTLAWLHGKPGCGKSFVALDMAACIAAGLPWQLHETRPGPVLYVIAEGVSGLRQRVRAWEDHAQQKTTVDFLPIAVQILTPGDLYALIMLAGELHPVLIVIDTQARVTIGADENSARDMGQFVAAVDKLRAATSACVLLVHHEARAGENMRGSTALEGAAATLIRVTKDGPHLRLDNTKQKDAAPFDPARLRLVPRLDSACILSNDGIGQQAEMSHTEETLLRVLLDSFETTGASSTTLREVSGVARSSYYWAINRLLTMGAVVNTGTQKRPHFMLPTSENTP